MQHLAMRHVPCPLPVQDKEGILLHDVSGKPGAIFTFLEGKSTRSITPEHLAELGTAMAQLHLAAKDFPSHNANDFSLPRWQEMYHQLKDKIDTIKPGLAKEIGEHLHWLEGNWPIDLPSGIIHGDLFPDNVFFKDGKVSGLIDFYFACHDMWMYDLAIVLNAWCFAHEREFHLTRARQFLRAYNAVRPLGQNELEALPVLASGAALRFLLTRLYDWVYQVEGALVQPKDPKEYLHKLRFHHGVKSYTEYGL